jgi:hypothetical protein
MSCRNYSSYLMAKDLGDKDLQENRTKNAEEGIRLVNDVEPYHNS